MATRVRMRRKLRVRDPVSVRLDGLREAGQWIQAAVSGSSAPGVEEARHLGGGQPPEVLEGLLHLGRLHTCWRDPHHPSQVRRRSRRGARRDLGQPAIGSRDLPTKRDAGF